MRKVEHKFADQFQEGEFFDKRQKHAKPQVFNTRIYFQDPESECVQVSRIMGTTSVAHRLKGHMDRNPTCRILQVKNTPHKRWTKPEHPLVARRKMAKARAERLKRQIPVKR